MKNVPRSSITIVPGHNPRTDVHEEPIEPLVDSIRVHGLLTPLTAHENAGGNFDLVAGERRITALDIIHGGETDYDVPILVTEADTLEAAIVENLQRQDLNVVDEARAYAKLRERGLTPAGIAGRLGIAKKRVTERLALLRLSGDIHALLRNGKLPPSTVKPLLAMTDVSPALAIAAAKRCSRHDHWGAILGKEPGKIALLLADDKQERFWRVPGTFKPHDLDLMIEVVKKDSPETVKRLNELISGLHELGKGDSYFVTQLSLHRDCADPIKAAGCAYEAPSDEYEGSPPIYVTDAVELLLDGLERELADRKQSKAMYAASMARPKRVKPTEALGPDATDEEKAAAIVQEAREKEQRRAEREADLAQRIESRGNNLSFYAKAIMEFAKGQRTDDVIRLLVLELVYALDLGRVGLAGFRFIYEACQEVEESTSKDGTKKVKVDYPTSIGETSEIVRKFILGGKSADDQLGRLLVVLTAAEAADQRAVAPGQRRQNQLSSNADAKKLRRKLARSSMAPDAKKWMSQRTVMHTAPDKPEEAAEQEQAVREQEDAEAAAAQADVEALVADETTQ